MPKALADKAIFIIADIYHAQAQYDALVERFDRNRVVALHRERVGAIVLDPDLAPGRYRPLTEAEIAG